MGQYYRPSIMGVEFEVKGWLYSFDYGNGQKLMEHSYMGNYFVNAVLAMIYHQPMRVAWIGDYSDNPYDGDEPYQSITKEKFCRIYEKVWGEVEDGKRLPNKAAKLSPKKLEGFEEPENFDGWYLINYSKQEYVDLGRFQKENGWREAWTDRDGTKHEYWSAIHPLPLLTACGNDRGGGDYHDCYPDWDKCGIWAFDFIEFSDRKPEGYAERIVHFKEEE